MSLILEALRKLDREKLVPERGFFVIAPASWSSSEHSRAPLVVFGLVVAMGAGAGLAYWFLRPTPPPPPVASTSSSTALSPATEAPALVNGPRALLAVPEPRPRPSPQTLPPLAGVESAPARALPFAQVPDPGPAATAAIPPKAPEVASERLAAPFVLQAISSREGSPVAIINGRMVREGDVIDGVTILKIGVETVELEVAGIHHLLRF